MDVTQYIEKLSLTWVHIRIKYISRLIQFFNYRERERGRRKNKKFNIFGTRKALIALPSVLSSARFTLSSSLNRRLCCFRSVSVAPNGCKSFRYVDDGVIMANSKERGTR